MKTKEKFPLTTFIKNVQSTLKKVVKFALNNVEFFWLQLALLRRLMKLLLQISICHYSFTPTWH